jgi:hypothetical protein
MLYHIRGDAVLQAVAVFRWPPYGKVGCGRDDGGTGHFHWREGAP